MSEHLPEQQKGFKQSLGAFFRPLFISGLLIWAPLLATVTVISFLVELLDRSLLLLPKQYQPDVLFGMHIPGLGVILSISVVLMTGFLATNYFGNQIVNLWEALLERIPLVRSVYTGVKQIVETVASPQGQAFKKVVMVEWPRRGMWSIAFQTTDTTNKLDEVTKGDHINVFVPATPNITSGFLMLVHKDDIKPANLNVEEALKLVVSLGVVQPVEGANKKAKRSSKKAS